jgi:hypothetical protein
MSDLNIHYNYIKELLEAEHSKTQTLQIVDYIDNDKERFEALMQLFFSDDWCLNQRAAWPMPMIVKKTSDLISPYLERLIDNLENPSHNAVVRNTVRLLQDIPIPEQFQGKVVDRCLKLIADPKEPTANRAFSMTVVYNISKTWPDLQNELRLLIESQMETESPGFKSRGRKILKAMGGK